MLKANCGCVDSSNAVTIINANINQTRRPMSAINLHNKTNHFQDVHLVSLASWRQANEFTWRDQGGDYMVTRAGFAFGTAALVRKIMQNLPSKTVMLRRGGEAQSVCAMPETDEMVADYQAGRNQAASEST